MTIKCSGQCGTEIFVHQDVATEDGLLYCQDCQNRIQARAHELMNDMSVDVLDFRIARARATEEVRAENAV